MAILSDLRFAIRLLVKDRTFVLLSLLTLALGIATFNTIFTIANALTRGLPVADADRIVGLSFRDRKGVDAAASYSEFRDIQTMAPQSLTNVAAVAQNTATVSDPGKTSDRVQSAFISAATFRLLSTAPILGRDFEPADDQIGAAPVVILGQSLWQGRYDSDPAVIGRQVTVNGVSSTVIGVMPSGFQFPTVAVLWIPVSATPGITEQPRNTRNLQIVARLKDGVSVRSAQEELASVAQRFARDHPQTNADMRLVVAPFPGPFAPHNFLIGFTAAATFVLLIACANVGNLLLVRSSYRVKEIELRVALGATRVDIFRQLLVESAVLGLIAASLGYGLSILFVKAFATAVSDVVFPYFIRFTPDARVFFYLTVVCVGAVFVLGCTPAITLLRVRSARLLQGGGTRACGGGVGKAWVAALLVLELTLTAVLLTGAALMMRSFLAIYRSDRVVDASNLLTMNLSISNQKYATPDQRRGFYDRLQERLRTIPSISSSTVTNAVPFAGAPLRQFSIEGQAASPSDRHQVSFVTMGATYLETLGLQLKRGRAFDALDGSPGHSSAIVNERLAQLFFAGQDPIGKRIRVTNPNAPSAPASVVEIVGISPTVRQQYFQDLDPVIYLPTRAFPQLNLTLIVRRSADAAAVTSALRDEIRALDPDVPVFNIAPMEQWMTQSRWGHRVFGIVFGLFALAALVLSAVGLYCVAAYAVTQQTKEIGIRLAMGAPRSRVVWLFLRRGLMLLAVGLTLGLAGAIGTGRLLQGFLIQTDPADWTTLLPIAMLLVAVALAASFFPALRASRLNPVVSLRHE